MHEVDMTKALIATIENWHQMQPEQTKIAKVHLIVGQFTCVEPASLQFAFAAQTRHTFLEGVALEIAETPLIGFCDRCCEEYRPEIGLHYGCPACGAPLENILSGRELKIDRIEYQAQAGVC